MCRDQHWSKSFEVVRARPGSSPLAELTPNYVELPSSYSLEKDQH